MLRKSASVNKAVRKAEKPKAVKATRKSATRVAESKSSPVVVKRQLKIQKALYEIADAASAVKDMQSFYKKLHKIVGKLMYAENFFIALYDVHTGLLSW